MRSCRALRKIYGLKVIIMALAKSLKSRIMDMKNDEFLEGENP
jgi:hypothetical protein